MIFGVLTGKKILLGVCGGIAAFKVAGWVRALREEGAEVKVVMTRAAERFVAPLTFAALSGNPVATGMFAETGAETLPHISLGKDVDLILVAPATAATIARLAHGFADDLLATAILASKAAVVVCPAMNCRMFNHAATQANLEGLASLGYRVVAPASGALACGEEGPGRLAEWSEVRQTLNAVFGVQGLVGVTMLVTAGPTREFFDPVRCLSNPSTGKMGFALAAEAVKRGARVYLVSGPTTLSPPAGVATKRVVSADEMRAAVMELVSEVDVVIMAAAVSDYRPDACAKEKIKKKEGSPQITLVRTPDILQELGRMKGSSARPLLVGFAAESHRHLQEGRKKLRRKNLDLVAVNDIADPAVGFASDCNEVALLDRDGGREDLGLLSKQETASKILDRVTALLV